MHGARTAVTTSLATLTTSVWVVDGVTSRTAVLWTVTHPAGATCLTKVYKAVLFV